MKQLTIICKKCGKVLRTKSYQGELVLNALEVNPCPNCLGEAVHEAVGRVVYSYSCSGLEGGSS